MNLPFTRGQNVTIGYICNIDEQHTARQLLLCMRFWLRWVVWLLLACLLLVGLLLVSTAQAAPDDYRRYAVDVTYDDGSTLRGTFLADASEERCQISGDCFRDRPPGSYTIFGELIGSYSWWFELDAADQRSPIYVSDVPNLLTPQFFNELPFHDEAAITWDQRLIIEFSPGHSFFLRTYESMAETNRFDSQGYRLDIQTELVAGQLSNTRNVWHNLPGPNPVSSLVVTPSGNLTEVFQIPDGDQNFDGVFDDADLQLLFDQDTYETKASTDYRGGDLNHSGYFDSRDLVWVMTGAQRALNGIRPVPEPSSLLLLVVGLASWWRRR